MYAKIDIWFMYTFAITKNQPGHGVIGLQTDDTLIVADNEFLQSEENAINLKAHYLAQRARDAHVATVSQPEAVFALSKAAQVTHPTESDVKALNKCLLWQKDNIQRGIKFVKLDINTVKVIVPTDSSFANNPDYSSQIGYITVLADESNRANLIHWSSIKCRRVM
ncbi:hypothetical protein K3495_g1183 [Podosphaera aphanis]|nr:hypothetical protein K3495_g1183 [Podosphaera aphanis]